MAGKCPEAVDDENVEIDLEQLTERLEFAKISSPDHLPQLFESLGRSARTRRQKKTCDPDEVSLVLGGEAIYPVGMNKTDALVGVSVTERRYEQIVNVCGSGSVEEWTQSQNQLHSRVAVINIPDKKFFEALRYDTYYEGYILVSAVCERRADHKGVTETVKLIHVMQADQACLFFATEDVFEKLETWKALCEKINTFQANPQTGRTITLGEEEMWQAQFDPRYMFETTEHASSGASSFQGRNPGYLRDTQRDNAGQTVNPKLGGSDNFAYRDGRYESDFEEIGKIGEGGFGIVVKARNKMDKVVYAVKKAYEDRPEEIFMEKMQREAELLAKLSHPNIVAYQQTWVERETSPPTRKPSIAESCSSNGESSEEKKLESQNVCCVLYIQMELCGKSLDHMLEGWNQQSASLYKTDDWEKAVLIIFRQLLEAVDYIHSKGIIHRDIKPANIFCFGRESLTKTDILRAEDEVLVKLGDFGLATQTRAHESSRGHLSRQNASGLTVGAGTRMYAAPELMKSPFYDSKVDIYSLGVVLAELVCLFPTRSECLELINLASGKPPARLQELSKMKDDLVHTILMMCSKLPKYRPSAKTLLESRLVVTRKTVCTENEELRLMVSLLIRHMHYQKQEAKEKESMNRGAL